MVGAAPLQIVDDIAQLAVPEFGVLVSYQPPLRLTHGRRCIVMPATGSSARWQAPAGIHDFS